MVFSNRGMGVGCTRQGMQLGLGKEGLDLGGNGCYSVEACVEWGKGSIYYME